MIHREEYIDQMADLDYDNMLAERINEEYKQAEAITQGVTFIAWFDHGSQISFHTDKLSEISSLLFWNQLEPCRLQLCDTNGKVLIEYTWKTDARKRYNEIYNEIACRYKEYKEGLQHPLFFE